MTVSSFAPDQARRGVESSLEPLGGHSGDRRVLGRVHYQHVAEHPRLHDGVPTFGVPMVAPGDEPFTEVWSTDRDVRSGAAGPLVYAEDGEHLFCAVRVDRRGVYRDVIRETYDAAFELITGLGYPELLRMWNLVGGIVDDNAEGMEVYRDFCVGRAEAFDAWSARIGRIPAATGIGTRAPGVNLYFLAGRADADPVHLENPNQTPAYEYPDQYGPKSPSFARGTYLRRDHVLYVSGTASIIGDETVRHDDISGQCDVTLANIESLVSAENLRRHGIDAGYRLTDLDLVKVYVRDAEDLPLVRARCEQAFGEHARVVYLNVDVCRRDLLVEIEGICR
ncbi:FkbO/Hyg5 family chorismatase [Saccharothrix obliqua]|uniref:FkbO/Hyg5 family chorismatase n=1 Tax=Saccharothrix obliqua TaxID=2861747 RepID=UPI001C5F53A3|nr:FkbO/Hyg5 family chorismatase [Saccharothrix obliqua]MBW4718114.1 FkbO/Hyg5 family chorismatase [Saccharothrix obliqua]